jgi:hypothetical protein
VSLEGGVEFLGDGGKIGAFRGDGAGAQGLDVLF